MGSYSNSSLATKLRFPIIFSMFLIGGYVWQKNFYHNNRAQILEERDKKLSVTRSEDAKEEKIKLDHLKRY